MSHTVALTHEVRGERSGIWSWITTVDHKRIGILYLVSSLAFFLVGGLLALLLRTQLAVPNNTFLSPDTYNQVFSSHALIMVFLALMPMTSAFFNFMVPLLIGARDVAFPRLNAFSYWVYLFGGILLVSSFLFGEAPNSGWTGYAPINLSRYSSDANTAFYVVGVQVLGLSSLASALNFFVTIINMRAPGMSLLRMPIFVWSTLVTSILILLAFPSLTIGTFLQMFDEYFATNFFNAGAGADPVIWQHLFWVFGHPEVYILILPAMGVISEVLPTFSRKPLFGYPFMVFSLIAIGFLSFGVWAHHMFTAGLGPVANTAFATSTMLIAIPTGIKIFNWLGTLWGGSIALKTPLLFAVGFVSMFTIGGISGVMHSSVPLDYWQHDTYFVVAHLHYVFFGGTMFGLFAAIYYWFPKMFGRVLGERLGQAHFWLNLVAFNLTFFPMHLLGIDGMPRRYFTYDDGLGWETWNFVETIGAYLLGLSVLILVVNIVRTVRAGVPAGADPWDGRTLEWSIPSPPPVHNFDHIPHVRSRDSFWGEKHGYPEHAPVLEPRPVRGGSDEHDHIHIPPPSYFPMLTALGLAILGIGFLLWQAADLGLFGLAVLIGGIALMLVSLFGWSFEPNE